MSFLMLTFGGKKQDTPNNATECKKSQPKMTALLKLFFQVRIINLHFTDNVNHLQLKRQLSMCIKLSRYFEDKAPEMQKTCPKTG